MIAPILNVQPPSLSFVRDPQIFSWFCNNINIENGTAYYGQLAIVNNLVAGDALSIKWGNGITNLIAADVPDDSGTQIPTGTLGNALTDAIVSALKSNHYLANDFYIEKNDTNIIDIYGLKAGTYYNCTILPNSTKFNISTQNLGTETINREGYEFIAEVKIGKQLTYNLGLAGGLATIDFKDDLKPFIPIKLPTYSPIVSTQLPHIIAYSVKYTERLGPGLPYRKNQETAKKYIILGGTGKFANEERSILSPDTNSQYPWLTYNRDIRPVYGNTNNYDNLSFLFRDTANYRLVINSKYKNAPDRTEYAYAGLRNANTIHAFQTGLEQLRTLGLINDGGFLALDIHIERIGIGQYSQSVKYIRVADKLRHVKRLCLLNSAGGWDYIWLMGKGENTIEREYNVAEGLQPNGRDISYGYDPKTKFKSKANTGYIKSLNTLKFLTELLYSEYVYEVNVDEFDVNFLTHTPIIITNKETNFNSEVERKLGFKVEWEYVETYKGY